VRGLASRAPQGLSSAIVSSLGLPDDALELERDRFGEVGHLSSGFVLHVFRDTSPSKPPADSPGTGSRGAPLLLPHSSSATGCETT